eukprot:CAMPEP_0168349924 /NCGR_PEP_ID=MMETSP0213-20121227/20767_1 /TAXON_ID=151035 /ORGANISM="Euplotes harpa, Strain FSP1.4" /LENGTH=208 /DNA_ID=CAMNT_0008360081 /DNA_START=52 /DNA_END=679 /DNA_ORIENTATION=-
MTSVVPIKHFISSQADHDDSMFEKEEVKSHLEFYHDFEEKHEKGKFEEATINKSVPNSLIELASQKIKAKGQSLSFALTSAGRGAKSTRFAARATKRTSKAVEKFHDELDCVELVKAIRELKLLVKLSLTEFQRQAAKFHSDHCLNSALGKTAGVNDDKIALGLSLADIKIPSEIDNNATVVKFKEEISKIIQDLYEGSDHDNQVLKM